MVEPAIDRTEIAALIRRESGRISASLAALVADWPKYADHYAADPTAFAQMEMRALVEYVALLAETGDENFRHLYIGEKAKQFHDPSADEAERMQREADILAAERAIFAGLFPGDSGAARLIHDAFDIIVHALTGEAKAEVKALFVGDCLYLDLISFLTAPALADGIRLRPAFVTTHSAAEIKAQLAKLADERFDVVFFSPFTYALLSDYAALQQPRVLLNPLRMLEHVKAAVADGEMLFDVIADLFDCPIIVHAPAPIQRSEGTAKERLKAALVAPALGKAARALSQSFRTRAAKRSAQGQVVHILDERAMTGAEGMAKAGQYLFRSELQHPAAFGVMIAPVYRDILMVIGRLLKKKLVVCDLDNTLWEGVIGEGLGVSHHYDRQAPLLILKDRGVVLAINSKNDPAKATWVAPEGKLALDHFVSRVINWEPKVLNMRRIAEHLNLKEKDFIFIDDRPDERAMMEEQIPAILSLDALDSRSWRLLSLWADLLPQKANADRTEFYRQRDERQKFIAEEAEMSAQQRGEMLGQLGLRLTLREADDKDVDRVTDLINRTNQFNMTGGRTTKRRVQDLVASDDAYVLVADAADRFGGMGTISVLIAEREGGQLAVPYFVLSCRVFGYAMEFAILEYARRFARPGEAMFGPFAETAFNQPCRDVYSTAGFMPIEGGWQLADADAKPIHIEPWLTIESELRTVDWAEEAPELKSVA
jgi:FkbH-like protein